MRLRLKEGSSVVIGGLIGHEVEIIICTCIILRVIFSAHGSSWHGGIRVLTVWGVEEGRWLLSLLGNGKRIT
jgi:hypothetical protein